MKDDRGKLDLSLLLDQHRKEIWEYKQKESEWEHTRISEENFNLSIIKKK